jgi:peptidoglycan/LPS O-acetylase OafA/YrhL
MLPCDFFFTTRFHVLDGMRGLAAILVTLHHYYYCSESRAPSSAHLRGTFLAVDFFFILSGFVICHSYGEKLLGGMRPADYLARRIARLYPIMVFGLLLGLPEFYRSAVSGHFVAPGAD